MMKVVVWVIIRRLGLVLLWHLAHQVLRLLASYDLVNSGNAWSEAGRNDS